MIRKYPTLKLCRHGITGQVGCHVPSGRFRFCHLAVDTVLTQVISDAAGSANKRDAEACRHLRPGSGSAPEHLPFSRRAPSGISPCPAGCGAPSATSSWLIGTVRAAAEAKGLCGRL